MALSRSEQMSRIRGRDTKPELAVSEALEARGFFGEPAAKTPAGKADLVFAEARVAVFIDGCFWHGCPLHYARPRSREEFWSAKLLENLERDARQSRTLTDAGWKVVRLWEHEVVEDIELAADRIDQVLQGGEPPTWHDQARIRRVVGIADRIERRELVRLGDPAVVVEAGEGPRVTAKARAKKS